MLRIKIVEMKLAELAVKKLNWMIVHFSLIAFFSYIFYQKFNL